MNVSNVGNNVRHMYDNGHRFEFIWVFNCPDDESRKWRVRKMKPCHRFFFENRNTLIICN